MAMRHVLDGGERPRHATRLRTGVVARTAALVGTAAVTFLVAATAFAVADLHGNIAVADVTDLLGTDRPTESPPVDPNAGRPLNVLLIGSDERNDENADIGGSFDGMRADTTMLMHISAERDRVELVSIPRDSWVDIPSCTLSDGTVTSPRTTKFNEAFAIGGQQGKVGDAAACTIKTVEQLTDVYVHDYAVVDFTGFISMVDALGGVPLCVPDRIISPKAKLELEAGYQTLGGRDALGYARARTGVGLGDGSDTGRIERQQKLLGATVRHALSQNLLIDSVKLYRFLDAATSSLTMSPDLASLPGLVGLGNSLRGLSSGQVTFLTVPWNPRGDGANVVWAPEAAEVFAKIAADSPLAPEPEPEPEPEPTAPGSGPGSTPGSTPTSGPTPTPSATGTPGDPTTAPSVPTTTPSATPSTSPTVPWDIMRADEDPDVCE